MALESCPFVTVTDSCVRNNVEGCVLTSYLCDLFSAETDAGDAAEDATTDARPGAVSKHALEPSDGNEDAFPPAGSGN